MILHRRIEYFDVAKGIAMLAVILGHSAIIAVSYVPSRIGSVLIAICFSFHMPLFFFFSGYFMHPERSFRWRREFVELILTYLCTAIVVILGSVFFSLWLNLEQQPESAIRTALSWCNAALYGAGDVSSLTLWPVGGRIGAIWFLLALFWGHLILHIIYHLPYKAIWVLLVFFAGYISSRFVCLPWSIQSGMCAVLFLYIGQIAKEFQFINWLKQHLWFYIVCAFFWIIAIVNYDGFSLAMNQYGAHPVLTFVGSVCGTVCILGISQFICVCKLPIIRSALMLTGRSSLALLCVHLVEDNIFPWQYILPRFQILLPHVPLTFIFFVVRLIFDIIFAVILYHVPKINAWFYPQVAKRRKHMDGATLECS